MYASMYSKTYKHTHTYKRIVMEFNGTRHVPAFHTEHHSLCKTAKKGKSMCEYVCFYIIFYCMYIVYIVRCVYFLFAFFPISLYFQTHTLCCVVLYCTVLYCCVLCVLSENTLNWQNACIFFVYFDFCVHRVSFILYCIWLCAFTIAWMFPSEFQFIFFYGWKKERIFWVVKTSRAQCFERGRKTKAKFVRMKHSGSSSSSNNMNKIQ